MHVSHKIFNFKYSSEIPALVDKALLLTRGTNAEKRMLNEETEDYWCICFYMDQQMEIMIF
jgi:hypothetical protein